MKSPSYFLYARKSTDDEEKQLLSIPAQLDELRSFAQKEQINIADIFIETKTAKIPGRAIFNEMIGRIEKGEVSGILAWHPDRLARNAVDAGKVVYLVDTGKIVDLKFPTFWFQNTPQGLFMLSIAFGQSKYYVDNLSENTKRGHRQKIRMGIYPNHAPLGYLNDRLKKVIVVDRSIISIVKQVFELYSSGKYTLEQISLFLFKHHIQTKNNRPHPKDRIKEILTNPFYYGYFRYNKEMYKGIHEPLITKKLFDRVQEVIIDRGRSHPKQPLNFPFAGLIHCGECGMMITAEQHIKYYKTINHGQLFVYYRCSKKNLAVKCLQPYITEDVIIPQLNQLIQKVSLSTDDYEWFQTKMNEDVQKETSSVRGIVQEFKNEINGITQQLDKLLNIFIDNLISRDEYLKKKEELMSKKKTLEEKITTLEQSPYKWLEPMREFFDNALQADKIASDNTNLFEKREFLKKTGSNLTLKDKRVDCDWLNQWAALQRRPTSRNRVQREGFEPSQGYPDRFTVYCDWPLRHLWLYINYTIEVPIQL